MMFLPVRPQNFEISIPFPPEAGEYEILSPTSSRRMAEPTTRRR